MPCTQLRHDKQCIQWNSMEVCGIIIISEARSWFAFTKHLSAVLLLWPENFENLSKSFPETHLEATVEFFTDLQIQKGTQN